MVEHVTELKVVAQQRPQRSPPKSAVPPSAGNQQQRGAASFSLDMHAHHRLGARDLASRRPSRLQSARSRQRRGKDGAPFDFEDVGRPRGKGSGAGWPGCLGRPIAAKKSSRPFGVITHSSSRSFFALVDEHVPAVLAECRSSCRRNQTVLDAVQHRAAFAMQAMHAPPRGGRAHAHAHSNLAPRSGSDQGPAGHPSARALAQGERRCDHSPEPAARIPWRRRGRPRGFRRAPQRDGGLLVHAGLLRAARSLRFKRIILRHQLIDERMQLVPAYMK